MFKSLNIRSSIWICAMLAISRPAFGQLWAGLGYHASFATQMKDMNYVLDKYNTDNTWVKEKFRNLGYFDGLVLKAGWWRKNKYLDLGFVFSGAKSSSTGTPPGDNEKQRDVKVNLNCFEISYGHLFRNEEKLSYGVGFSPDWV